MKHKLFRSLADFESAMLDCNKQHLDDGVYQVSRVLEKFSPGVQVAILAFYFTCILDLTGLSAGTVCGIIDGIRRGCNLSSLKAAYHYMINEW